MSRPASSLEWFQSEGGLPSSEAYSSAAAQVVGAAAAYVASLADSQRSTCLRAALAIASHGATLFQPRFAGPAELRWCRPDGQPAPVVSFPKDFVDRRSVVAWSLYRLTVATPVDEPIFSAQARVTMLDNALATFHNFNKPAASVISSEATVAALEGAHVPSRIREELERATSPIVYVMMQEPAGFDDVILYTALSNFGRAFCAFQTGPWPTLRRALFESQPLYDLLALSLPEMRLPLQRAALAATESAWDASYRLPIGEMQSMLVGILGHALLEAKA